MGRLYQGFLTVTDQCSECREALGHIRADDIPAYFTILIVGHLVVPLVVLAVMYDVPDAISLGASLGLTVVLTLALLPSVKGAIVAHLWKLRLPESLAEAE
jgi:uncharacterized protein (DUF983 family)